MCGTWRATSMAVKGCVGYAQTLEFVDPRRPGHSFHYSILRVLEKKVETSIAY